MWSLYEPLVTRWPPAGGAPGLAVDLSATIAPSSTRQLAAPVWSQPVNVLPSKSWVQPGPDWACACVAGYVAPKPATMNPAMAAHARAGETCMCLLLYFGWRGPAAGQFRGRSGPARPSYAGSRLAGKVNFNRGATEPEARSALQQGVFDNASYDTPCFRRATQDEGHSAGYCSVPHPEWHCEAMRIEG